MKESVKYSTGIIRQGFGNREAVGQPLWGHSRQLQPIHCRAQLRPLAKVVVKMWLKKARRNATKV